MLKRLSLILITAAITASAGWPAGAATQPSLFDAMYWVRGKVTVVKDVMHPASVFVEGRRPVFYKVLPGGFVEQKIVPDNPGNLYGTGNYMLNIYDNAALAIDPTVQYYAAVAQDPNDKYGADPVPVTITGKGFEVADMNVAYGKGPIIPLAGALQLGISRTVNGIKIMWDKTIETDPNIYFLTGDGSGKFTNDPTGWKSYTTASSDFDDTAKASGYIIHSAGTPTDLTEVYYKATQKAFDINSQPQVVQSAWAVGKVDLVMHKGWNSVSVPFVGDQFGGPSGLVGDNFGEGDTAGFWDYSVNGSQDMTANKRFSVGPGWDNPTISSPLAQGCMFNLSSLTGNQTRKVSLIGSVAASYTSRDINPKWNHIGSPLAKGLPNGEFVGAYVDPASQLVVGDTVQRWGGTDFDFTARYLGGDAWDQPLNFAPGVGYWFNHVSTAQKFKWTPK